MTAHGNRTVTLSRAALRDSVRPSGRDRPLVRAESGGPADDQELEIPVPLAEVREQRDVRVLHVDDDPAVGDLVETVFADIDEDFNVVTETGVVAALDRLGEGRFDCIVSDYQMPTTDGLEFLHIVREQYPDIPFILFTGKGSEEIASEAISAGVTDYMQKGSGLETYEVLANRVTNAVEQYRTEEQFWSAFSWYRRLVEQDLAGVCIVQGGTFAYVNQRFADLFGYAQDDIVGEPPRTVLSPADADRLAEAVQNDSEGDTFEDEVTGHTGDGDQVTVAVSGGPIEYDDDPAWIGVVCESDDT